MPDKLNIPDNEPDQGFEKDQISLEDFEHTPLPPEKPDPKDKV